MIKPKGLLLHKIPGLELISDDDPAKRGRERHSRKYTYKLRDKWEDMEVTKAFYDEYPPEVGDLVVVLHTASGYRMLRPDVKPIIAITKQKRLVVDHIHEAWAGKSFWRTGQNCKAPRGQCWLVPAELYRDIPKDGSAQRSPSISAPSSPDISVGEMAAKYGGAKQFLEEVKVLMEDYGLTQEEAQDELRCELKSEAFIKSRGGKDWLDRTVTRKSIQNHNRHFLQNGKARKDLQIERESEMISKGQARGYSRLKNRFGG